MKVLYEGKAKVVFELEDPDLLLIEFKDTASAFNRKKLGVIEDKGRINARMSALLFQLVEKGGIPTHFVELKGDNQMIVKRLQMLPVEVVVRNKVAGSLARRLGLKEGLAISEPLCEFYYKSDELGDPLVTRQHIRVFGWATQEQIDEMCRYALKVDGVLSKFFDSIGIELIDYKLEFGVFKGRLLLGDELSPDGMRLWDKATGKKLDKDRFRFDMDGVKEAYEEVLKRIISGIK